ncbi:MAG TPA: hypothetical protein VJ859_02430 [Allosphingosinicella sp.]|nr:hypothetical protein [Allosphingosinicella sp.]
MTNTDQIQLHSERAMAEFDQALRASSIRAAQAHFGLSALHLERMRRLNEAKVRTQAKVLQS